MKRRINKEAVKGSIDNHLFVEWVLEKDEHNKSERSVCKHIDTRDNKALERLKAQKLKEYLKQHPDNTETLFTEVKVERAKELQTYFSDYRTNTEDKEYYFALQRWIDCLTAPKDKADNRYWINSFFDKQVQTTHEYKGFKRDIENNGCIVIKTKTDTAKIYTPELAVFFTSNELPARNMDTKKETTINGWEYLQTFIDAYKEGEQYFESEFKVSPSTLYGENAEQYVRDIHLNFFHVQHTALHEGWGYVKSQYPFILTYKAIREFGYYSGIVNKVEEQVKKHPKLFATFDKCDHDTQPLQTETKTDKLKTVLGKYGFFELPIVKQLSEPNQQRLIELISTNDLPYSIAMLEYSGLLKHLKLEHFKTDNKLFIEVAKWFDVTDRAVKGNIYVLNPISKENRARYTAHLQKETAQKDYEGLK
jgi:hypothetical protein